MALQKKKIDLLYRCSHNKLKKQHVIIARYHSVCSQQEKQTVGGGVEGLKCTNSGGTMCDIQLIRLNRLMSQRPLCALVCSFVNLLLLPAFETIAPLPFLTVSISSK